MQGFANSVFQGFLRELARATPRSYFNSKRVIQSSVGMIFRLHPNTEILHPQQVLGCYFDRIQLLFTQRAGYEGDRNAFNIVFPGGQCDQAESDLQACKRQLHQEIGLQVDEQCVYMGQLPSNFYYLGKRGKDVYITCHVWCMKAGQENWKERLNPSQLCASRWVNLLELLNSSNYLIEQSLRLGILERIASKYKFRFIADISKQVHSISTPQLNIGMKRNLWGLTLWIWSYALQMACTGLTRRGEAQEGVKEVQGWVKQMEMLQVKFKEGFLLKYPVIAMIKSWHYFNRSRPFTYRPHSFQTTTSLIIAIIITILAAILLL